MSTYNAHLRTLNAITEGLTRGAPVVIRTERELTKFSYQHRHAIRAAFPPAEHDKFQDKHTLSWMAEVAFGNALRKGPVRIGDVTVSLASLEETQHTAAAE